MQKRCLRIAWFRIPRHARRVLSVHADGVRYLRENPDVAASGGDPLAHWWTTGAGEGRRMPGVVLVERAGRGGSGRPRRALVPDPEFSRESAFERLVDQHADHQAYLDANPDVRVAGLEPVHHWLTSGMLQGRRMPGLDVFLRRSEEREGWTRLRWLGQNVLVRVHDPLPGTIQRAIRAQAQFEPGILAAGPETVGSLRRVEALDLWDRDGLDLAGLLTAMRSTTYSASVVIVVPELAELSHLDVSDDVFAELVAPAPRNVLLLVTRQFERDAPSTVRTPAGVVRRETAVHVLEHLRPGGQAGDGDALLSRLIHALDPDTVHGLDPRRRLSS